MNGIKELSIETEILQAFNGGGNIYVPLYYDSESDTVFTNPGEGRDLVTHILNKVTPSEIQDMVNKWKWQ